MVESGLADDRKDQPGFDMRGVAAAMQQLLYLGRRNSQHQQDLNLTFPNRGGRRQKALGNGPANMPIEDDSQNSPKENQNSPKENQNSPKENQYPIIAVWAYKMHQSKVAGFFGSFKNYCHFP